MNIREAVHWSLVRHPRLAAAMQPLRSPVRAVVKHLQFRQIAAQSARAPLTLVREAPTARPGKVAVIMTVRNEVSRLPAFLLHYRALGIAEFLVVDNGSTDGTSDFLAAQPDVTLYSTAESYKAAHYGITWVNRLMHSAVARRWALFVDADELLHTSGMARGETLHELAERLESRHQSYMYAPLVDLYDYEDELVGAAASPEAMRLALAGAWQDVEGYRADFALGNGYRALKGGPRGRLAAAAGELEPSLVKYPLLQQRPGRYFTASAHEFMPAVGERHAEHGWLVHLKLGRGVHRYHADPVIEREHYGGGTERRRIAAGAAAEAVGGDPTAVRFAGLSSLARLNDKILSGRTP